ncbi:hypothetical protein BHU61_06790 [Macrococcus epidermidis]|uniref:Uncharacterized protein n=1 Tax=Macrococcus epidermidis TaxID=1902580 RepID=A0A327ZRR3_9STAP|nr:hypothetical protein [Macrococcus epidermidis]RAK45013.1 hypothetical protein BHU61_06790 [Macrococcus epidermidis]
MTSEICIMNSLGAVLAADSAVTISGSGSAKTYDTVNKIFSMDKHDIGIMINGNLTFNKLSLDIVIKEFKKQLPEEKYNTVNIYASKFLEFLNTFKESKTSTAEIELINLYIYNLINEVNRRSELMINEVLSTESTVQVDSVQKIITRNINDVYQILDQHFDSILTFDDNYFEINYNKLVEERIWEHFAPAYITDEIITLFITLVKKALQTNYEVLSKSSIVFAGYGKEDVLPSMIELELYGSFNGVIKHRFNYSSSISIRENFLADIKPFAQDDMIETVIKGIHPEVNQNMINCINGSSIPEQEKINIINEIDGFQKTQFVHPFLQTIVNLPLEELPSMAETLINLTSFKRKYSQNIETVGGPVDILMVSKGEGPIWIKRKHYFKSELNLEYLNRKGV